MTDLQDKTHCPTLEEIGASVGNPLFQKFCTKIKTKYIGRLPLPGYPKHEVRE